VLTLVGTGGAVDDAVVVVGVAVDVGVGVGVGVVVVLIADEVELDEELEIGAGNEEDGGGATPLHVPKELRHPVPQYWSPLPQKYHSEQQLPKPEPAQVVTFPHWPLGETISVPDGSGGRTDELDGRKDELDGTTVELEAVTTVELDDGVGVGVGVGLGVSEGASPHRPYCG
jgi:hypothetical protein